MTTEATNYKREVALTAKIEMRRLGLSVSSEPVFVILDLHPPHRRKYDADNRSKLILDALENHVYRDDAQVVELLTRKHEKTDTVGVRLRVMLNAPTPTNRETTTR